MEAMKAMAASAGGVSKSLHRAEVLDKQEDQQEAWIFVMNGQNL